MLLRGFGMELHDFNRAGIVPIPDRRTYATHHDEKQSAPGDRDPGGFAL